MADVPVHPPPAQGIVREIDLDVVAYQCTAPLLGNVCLGYDAQTPGPMLIVDAGDTLFITVHNRIAETVVGLTASQSLKDRLAAAPTSFHTHGMTMTVTNDGVLPHAGTQLVDSSVPPGGQRLYTLKADTPGAWHYHDHVLGPDGAEGQTRGLYGSLYVVPANTTTTGLDLHLLNTGPNGGRGLTATVAAGTRFDLLPTALGDYLWTVKLFAPGGALLAETVIGPGVSESMTVSPALAGTYTWTAKTVFLAPTYSGTVTVQ